MVGLSRRQGIALLIVAVLVTAILVYPWLVQWGGREPQLSAYDEDWNDVKPLRLELEADPAYQVSSILSSVVVLEDVADPEKTVLLVIGNEKGYSDLELEVITNFVRAGGALVVAGDFDRSNQLANLFTFGYAGVTLWDENYGYDFDGDGKILGPELNTSFIPVNTQLNGTSYTLLYNTPTALMTNQPIPSGTWKGDESILPPLPLARSSARSWLDTDGNGYVSPDDDDNDGKGAFPLITMARVSVTVNQGGQLRSENRGQAFFFGDASWLTQSMWDKADNLKYFQHLMAFLLPQGGTIIFDESIHTQGDFPASFYQSVLSFYFTLSGDTPLIKFLKVITFILISFGVVYAFLQAREPTYWLHRFRVHLYTPHPHHYSQVIPRLQEVFINRIRLKLGLMDLPQAQAAQERLHYLQKVLQQRRLPLDSQLNQLLFDPNGLAPDQERLVAEKVFRWEP